MFATLDAVLADLDRRGELLRIPRSVDPKFELAAVLQAAQRADNRPVLFEKVKDTRFPVVSNVFGSYERVARVLGVEPSSVARRWAEIIEGRTALSGQMAEEVIPYEHVSIHDLPQLTFCEKDAGPYLTASVIVARDVETGRLNASYHRMQIIDDGELRCRLSPSGDLFRLHARGEARGEALPAVVLLGAPPPLMLAAAATVGPDLSEVEVAEQILGRHLPRVECKTAGLIVPAGAPVMIEGEILAGVRKPEGPFGEWMDYYVPVTDNHVFRVHRVLAQRNARFYAILAGSVEEVVLTAVPITGMVYQAVRRFVPTVRDVTCWPTIQFCVIQLKKQSEGQSRKAILAAFGAELNRILYCVAVDEDVNIRDVKDVLWAMSTRCRPDRDIFQISNVPSFARDPHQIHWGRVGIDATAPLEWPAEFERKRVPGIEDVRLGHYLKED